MTTFILEALALSNTAHQIHLHKMNGMYILLVRVVTDQERIICIFSYMPKLILLYPLLTNHSPDHKGQITNVMHRNIYIL